MDLPQGRVSDQSFWHEHLERVKTYSGTIAAYCRQHSLDYEKFMYYRGKSGSSHSAMIEPSGFAKVQATKSVTPELPIAPTSIAKPKTNPQMPDPKWLAELIHSLIYNK